MPAECLVQLFVTIKLRLEFASSALQAATVAGRVVETSISVCELQAKWLRKAATSNEAVAQESMLFLCNVR